MALTQTAAVEAIKQVIALCETCEHNKDYTPISMREALNMLGFTDIQEILRYTADHGFDYCLDHTIPATSYPDFVPELPPQQACYWGPDQLKSRLQFVL